VESADKALRLLARWLLDRTDVRTVAEISRDDIEGGTETTLALQASCSAIFGRAFCVPADERSGVGRVTAAGWTS
jgi:predicted phosphoribosyltransferase